MGSRTTGAQIHRGQSSETKGANTATQVISINRVLKITLYFGINHRKEGKEKKGKRKIEGGIGRGSRKGMLSKYLIQDHAQIVVLQMTIVSTVSCLCHCSRDGIFASSKTRKIWHFSGSSKDLVCINRHGLVSCDFV